MSESTMNEQLLFPKWVSGQEMSWIDQLTIQDFGISGAELMENAGRKVVDIIRDRSEGLEGLTAAIVCGKGNNGGDGFVVARLLHQAGVPVQVFSTAATDAFSGDAAHHLRLLSKAGVAVQLTATDAFHQALKSVDLIIDAIHGTGLTGAARADTAAAIKVINGAGPPIVAVDMPSGVEADTGAVHGACVEAAMTVTFGLPKIGQLMFPGRSHCGDLHLVDIGFPSEAIAASPVNRFLIDPDGVNRLLPRRTPEAHKGSCGSVAVVAGSAGMTGAAALTADAALSAGAGRVTLGVPASLHDILEIKLTEVMTRALPEVRRHRCLSLRALGDIHQMTERADCLAIGPGLGTHRETAQLVRRCLSEPGPPVVVDADGLNALAAAADIADIVAKRKGPVVFTPHLGEFARLAGLDSKTVLSEHPDAESDNHAPLPLISHALDLAGRLGVTLVLKGAPTLVALADGRLYANPTGNAGMATAGAGDVLTGTIAGLIAQGLHSEQAAVVGVYLHGLAGDLAKERIGEWGMKAGDIGQLLPKAILETAGKARVAT
jgi:NAD(P)H-hydrate epimerase